VQLLQSGDLLRGLVALALEVRRGTPPGLLGGGLGLLPQLLRGADRRGVQLVGLLARRRSRRDGASGHDGSGRVGAARHGEGDQLPNRLCSRPRRVTVPGMGGTEDLATNLGVYEGDVRVLLRQLGEQTPDLPDELASFLRELLDPHGERTAPAGLYWPGAHDEPRRTYGVGGPDPTASSP
jgi:hypothetical protein